MMKFMLQLHKLTKMSRAENAGRMGALENQAEQTWTTHQVTSLNELVDLCHRRRTAKPEKKIAHGSNGRTSKASKAKSRASARVSVRSSTRSPSPTGCEWRRS